MGWLALGYFLSYIPYAMLVKALSSGLLPGLPGRVGGLSLLPAAAIGQLLVMPVFLRASGLWRRYGGWGEPNGPAVLSVRQLLITSSFTALIIGTTTLNYTFAGLSILFMLLLMRAGVLILSPVIDTVRRRRVGPWSWVAVGFSLTAVGAALADVTDYRLTIGAVLSLAVYFTGYIGRFQIMSRAAKTGAAEIDRRYFVQEHAVAPIAQVVLLAIPALFGQRELREGFTGFLGTPQGLVALVIGVAYEVLFIFGTLIYLDHREYAWCVPANRGASLLSGLVASYALTWLAGQPPPGTGQLVALVFLGCAIAALCYPTLAARRGRLLLFVCGGNTSRSAMAEYLARSELDTARLPRGTPRLRVASAGVAVAHPGAAMAEEARSSLAELGVARSATRGHRASSVTPALCRGSAAIYCMTHAQRDQVLALTSEVDARVLCLDQAGDIRDPAGHGAEAYRRCARHIQHSVHTRLCEQVGADVFVPVER